MTDKINQPFPLAFLDIENATKASNFTMSSEVLTCSLLRTIARSKPAGKFLELGTGTGLSTSWILDGMDENSSLISIDNDSHFQKIADSFLGDDKRLRLVCTDGGQWIETNSAEKFDYIFADTWHGKFLMLEQTLTMLNKGGIYIVDDMIPQAHWPDGHREKVDVIIDTLEKREDLTLTKMTWASGIIIAVKK